MFRRKDEAYDDDLLHDVMSSSQDDELLDTSAGGSESNAANSNTKQSDTSASNKSQAQASSNSASSEQVTPTPAPAASKPAPAAASAPAASKPSPAAAFRPQPAQPAPAARNLAPADSRGAANLSANPKSSKRVLTVGHDIHMKGEISTCDRLMIEGSVDATLLDVHTVELTQTGSFKGTAEIEDAEISGQFEGDLIVNGRLTIYSTGRVNGNVSYGEIEIERGGQLTGSIKTAEQIKSERNSQPQKKAA